MKKEEIRIRDPFILTDKENGCYYMYGTTSLGKGLDAGDSFSAYISKDLENFEGPYVIFDGGKTGFWATRDYWASEVHKYGDSYYLLGSFKSDNHCRATQILKSHSPIGEFKPISACPQTPDGWECLDGTLWIENKRPYLVFCHEWLQCENGEIYAVELSSDLATPVGKPFLLFKASDNPCVDSFEDVAGKNCRVTDGPFLFSENGKLKMIWSSFASGKYAVLEAEADGIHGSWTHFSSRFPFDGGHAMIFEDLHGKKFISLHMPNTPPDERAVFIPYEKNK